MAPKQEKHETRTEYEGKFWRAECSCGWFGVSAWTEVLALADASIHLQDSMTASERIRALRLATL